MGRQRRRLPRLTPVKRDAHYIIFVVHVGGCVRPNYRLPPHNMAHVESSPLSTTSLGTWHLAHASYSLLLTTYRYQRLQLHLAIVRYK